MSKREETFFNGELNPLLNQWIQEKDTKDILSILQNEKMIFVLGREEENSPFHYIENKKTNLKYIMGFTSLEDLNVWKEKAGIENPNITVGTIDFIYTLASMEEIQSLGGIVLDPCTLNKIIDIASFLEIVEKPSGTILKSPEQAPSHWISAMKNLFAHEKGLHKAYVQVENNGGADRYLVIIDIEASKQDKFLQKLASISEKYADLPVAYASLKANPSLETALEPFYKK